MGEDIRELERLENLMNTLPPYSESPPPYASIEPSVGVIVLDLSLFPFTLGVISGVLLLNVGRNAVPLALGILSGMLLQYGMSLTAFSIVRTSMTRESEYESEGR